MLSPRPGYHRHSSKYKRALLQLQSKYASLKDIKERRKLLDDFSDNYLMPMEYWSIRLRNNHSNPLREDFFDNPHRKALFHFCQDFRIQGYCTSDMLIYRQTKPLEYMGYDPKATLTYPNRKLRQTFMDLKEEAMEPLPKSTEKRVDEMEVLYWKIKECEDNQEEWIKCLQEVDNLKFLKRNVEQRLSFNLCNKKLWKLYINHLKTADPKEMLQVYSKYCRFFMDDEEMLEEYKEAAEEHGPVLVKWKNLFNFETKDSNEEYPENVDREFDDEPLLPYSEYVFEFGKFEAQSQPWSFPSPLIRYIRCNSNPHVLRKLHQTCKYFFALHPQILCYHFSFDSTSRECSSTLIIKESFFNSANSFLPIYQKNLHITSTLKMIHRNPKMLSNVIRKCIYKCDAVFITLYNQELTETEFHFLVGHGNVEKLDLRDSIVKSGDDNDDNLKLVEMLKILPKIRYFDTNCLFKSKTTPVLSELIFLNKFMKFVTVAFNHAFDPDDFYQFLKKNAAPFSIFRFEFGYEVSAEKVKELKETAKKVFENQKLADGRPDIRIIHAV